MVLSAGVLLLGVGCGGGGEAAAFVGDYQATGTWTLTLDRDMVFSQTYAQTIMEGISADLVFADERGCKLPAQVQGEVATFTPDAKCQLTMPTPMGPIDVDFRMLNGTARREGESILLDCTGLATSPDPSEPTSGGAHLEMELIKKGS